MKLFHSYSVNLEHYILIIILLFFLIFPSSTIKAQPLIQYIKPVSAICIRAVDADTLIVIIAGIKERVRLIGVDTPETRQPTKTSEHYGKEAFAFTWRTVEGKRVRLEFDQNQRDKYKQLFAYVYLEDGTFLNAEIIKQGYGRAYTKFPFKYMNEFRAHEKEARARKRGLWK